MIREGGMANIGTSPISALFSPRQEFSRKLAVFCDALLARTRPAPTSLREAALSARRGTPCLACPVPVR